MPLSDWVNWIEVFLWSIAGIAVLASARRCGSDRRALAITAGIAFLLFAGSDYVELSTGAWWKPPWLLAWKAACVAALLWCLVRYARLKKRP